VALSAPYSEGTNAQTRHFDKCRFHVNLARKVGSITGVERSRVNFLLHNFPKSIYDKDTEI
jgi:hypothetical protein